jgi:hypothetical protein
MTTGHERRDITYVHSVTSVAVITLADELGSLAHAGTINGRDSGATPLPHAAAVRARRNPMN